jgi:superfamily I DNA/RNA helicase
MQEGDIVISRINANLPAIAFSLIRKGKTARILGRDIGKSLKGIIEKQKASDLSDLFTKLNEFREKQMSKFMSLNKPDKISQLDDQLETISALSEGANSVWDVITRCQTMFSDDQIGISLGTIHKNKGREAKNVFITRPDLIPLPFVMQKGSEEDKIQELNGKYVACTRPTENLIFCQGEL